MVDEKVDEKSEKEDNNLSIRYGKLKDKHSSLEVKLAELQAQLEQEVVTKRALTEKNVELDKMVKTSTQELQTVKELQAQMTLAVQHGVKDLEYFNYRLGKAKTEAGATPLDMDKFFGGLKEESAQKGLNLFGEKVIPQTTSAITKAPQQTNSTPASNEPLQAEFDKAVKEGNLGRQMLLKKQMSNK